MGGISLDLTQLLLALALAAPLAYFLATLRTTKPLPDESEEPYREQSNRSNTTNANTNTMAAPNLSGLTSPAVNLQAPKLELYTQEQLKQHDGTGANGTIYVAIKGTVFDVTAKKEMYGPGGSYHIFAGKDASKGLAISSVKAEDAVPDYSGLDEQAIKTLDGWYDFFQKRYNIVGTVSDLPAAVSRF